MSAVAFYLQAVGTAAGYSVNAHKGLIFGMFKSRHFRFILAFCAGLLAGAGAFAMGLPTKTIILITANLCFAAYLALELRLVRGLTPDKLRARAAQTDEGVPLIFVLALSTIMISLSAIFLVINRNDGSLTEVLLALVFAA